MGEILGVTFNLDRHDLELLDITLSDFITNSRWAVPEFFEVFFPTIASSLLNVTLPIEHVRDYVVWVDSTTGELTSKEAYHSLLQLPPALDWAKQLWHFSIQPRKSICTWKAFHHRLLTDDVLQRRGVSLCSKCVLCGAAQESWRHIFWECSVSAELWAWCFGMFRVVHSHQLSLNDILSTSFLSVFNPSARLLWRATVCNLIWCLWTERNSKMHEGGIFNMCNFRHFFISCLKESASLAFASSHAISTTPMFHFLGFSQLSARAPRFIMVNWHPPPTNCIKVNIDGSFSDSETAGFGGIARAHDGSFMFAFASRVRVWSALDAEILAFLEAIQLACLKKWDNVWIESDSVLVVKYYSHPRLIPWRWRTRWLNGLHMARHLQVKVSHIYREGNVPADRLAHFGASNWGSHSWSELPHFLASAYGRDLTSLPFYRTS